jgi:hypothetical protein
MALLRGRAAEAGDDEALGVERGGLLGGAEGAARDEGVAAAAEGLEGGGEVVLAGGPWGATGCTPR